MKITPTRIPDVLVVEPQVFGDARGFFFESFHQRKFEQALGRPVHFVQDNHSRSARGVLRGLHYQLPNPQGKLVRVVEGEILDVAVDVRRDSPTFGKWESDVLSAENKRQLWVPEGFAHGFLVLSDVAQVLYKTTGYYSPQDEQCIRWDDPAIGIPWPLQGAAPILSAKDAAGKPLALARVFEKGDLAP
ncbi:MAG: dTDP-4-dehydrorhamnose 3,5-epimerase [Anaeromyxobacteraceae bacterium]